MLALGNMSVTNLSWYMQNQYHSFGRKLLSNHLIAESVQQKL